jgi:hypothetical protein
MFSDREFLEDNLRQCLQEAFESEGEKRKAEETLPLFLEKLSGNRGSYDPMTPGQVACLYQIEDVYLLDLNLIMAPLMAMLMNLQLDSEMRQIKGSHFETFVAKRLPEDCPEILMPMKPGLKLKRVGQPDAFAELDAYVQVGPIFFLVECKAYSLTREYFRGDSRAVINRRILVEQWLDRSDRRAHDVAESPIGANYKIPDEVTHVIPVVCSAFPEFMWTFEEGDFLVRRKVPRACTYHELAELLSNPESRASMLLAPYAVPVKRT